MRLSKRKTTPFDSRFLPGSKFHASNKWTEKVEEQERKCHKWIRRITIPMRSRQCGACLSWSIAFYFAYHDCELRGCEWKSSIMRSNTNVFCDFYECSAYEYHDQSALEHLSRLYILRRPKKNTNSDHRFFFVVASLWPSNNLQMCFCSSPSQKKYFFSK